MNDLLNGKGRRHAVPFDWLSLAGGVILGIAIGFVLRAFQ